MARTRKIVHPEPKPKRRVSKPAPPKPAPSAKKMETRKAKGYIHKRKHNSRRKYMELGRVVLITNGRNRNTIAMVVDIVDQNWVMIDGTVFDQLEQGRSSERRLCNIKDLQLTHLKTKIRYRANAKWLKWRIAEAKLVEEWHKCPTFQKLEDRRHKKLSTDLERWRVQYNRKQRSFLIKAKYGKLKKKVLCAARVKHAPKNPVKYEDRVRGPAPDPKSKRSLTKHVSKLTTKEKVGLKKLKLNLRSIYNGR